MAIVKNPALSSEASGNVGGLCYTRWRELQVVRGPWTGTVPNTTDQQTYQAFLTTVSKKWSELLTALERVLWEEAAETEEWTSRLGTNYRPSGYQLYLKYNIQRLVVGMTLTTVPIIKVHHAQIRAIFPRFGYSATQIDVRTSVRKLIGEAAPYCIQYWRAGPFDTPGHRAMGPEYRLKQNETDPGDSYKWTDYPPVQGKWYWYKCRAVWEWGGVTGFRYCHGKHTLDPPGYNWGSCVDNS